MISALGKYYLSLHYWNHQPADSIKKMQLNKFRDLFTCAREKSKFYREYYGDHGVLDLKIRSLEDIKKVPIINKSILRSSSTRDIMTRDLDGRTNVHSTSGSTGEPFRIAFGKYEDYTAYVRVYWTLKKAGYRMTDKIAIVTRYESGDRLQIENDISVISRIQGALGLFRREIISIYEPVDDIISQLLETKARILWSTPSIMQLVCLRLAERGTRLGFPIVYFTSEAISAAQKELFLSRLGKRIVSLYGAMESPSLGFDSGLTERSVIFPNSNLFEFENEAASAGGKPLGRVVITNLINKTMPIIRYDLNDMAEMEDHPEFGCKYIGRIVGRKDDILDLGNGRHLAHHHAYEMFRDFHECEMYKFIQKPDKTVLLRIQIAPTQSQAPIEKLARERWKRRFGEAPLQIEFVNGFKIDPGTGKFKNIEVEPSARKSS